ncbi:hypothetical protein TVAG_021540 [Trichomonas vaginalis G3]|uniref:BEACH domain-containing protein n=1 Tax=Trichomonas vaginalis (strain ATCC PRA-98 / G3) TaxID=412133 RepID=A2DHD4_TRIV3|nr:aggrephagy protein [Trichomonas vaginalis G3]EAY20207.1 hypothetical protein TVAG_021540 [Trichomonas vaginalis G3]KAI5507702.1 aggrephagy protein [Trichomonas vaginalis G3]|eukprot:XP_001581193.1 hypothetical protein [Trichomonas vaginalis G3]
MQSHSNNLVEMYLSSPFGKEKFESLQKVPIQISSLKNIGDVLALSNYDIDGVKLFYECKTDKHNFVQSNFLDEMVNAHNSFELNSGDILFFNYMIGITKQNNLIPSDQRNQLLNSSVEFFDKNLSAFERKYKNSLKKAFASMNSMLNSQNKFVEEMTINHFEDYKNDGNNIIVNEFENSLKDFCNMITSMTVLVKDKTYSYNFCQLKKKRTTEKKFKTVPQINDQLLTYKVFLIKGIKILQSEFHICKDKILVVYSYSYKEIKFNRITYVFARQNVKGEVTNLEIYTVDGKSYLFDFISIDSQTVIKNLPKNLMNNLKFMTVSFKQKDLFSGLNLTNLWEISNLSTFDYLMLINIFSGRTFNNTPEMQPIFPPILSDFKIFGCVYDFTKTVEISNDLSIESISKMKNVNARVYFDPTLPGNLPNWCKDRYDFISHIRKLLESHGTSKLIPKWIDQNFGKEMSKRNSKHKQVFSKLHPQRQNVLKMITKNYKRQLNTSSKNKILFTSCNLTETAENSIVLSFFLSNNTLTTINCLLSDDFKVISTSSVETMEITPNSSFSATEKSLVLYTPEKRQAVVYNRENKVQGSYVLYCETNMISYYENSFLFCPDFCTISILDESKPKPTVLTHSPCRLSSLASSNKYKIFAYGTIDGHVCVHSLSMSKSNFVNKTHIVEEAEHIVITNNYGFIVCSTATKFIVMSVNGEIIREFTHNKEIVNLFSFDCLGADFIAFVTNDNKVGYFEVFHPENAINFLQIREHIELVTYNYATATFIVITNESIRFIPYSNIV